MCNFFSFVTDPVNHPAEYYYFDWKYRKGNLDDDGVDSHSHICSHFKLNEDTCNKYEFNPLTKKFVVDQINSDRDDSEVAEKWANRLDFKTIVKPLIDKPIVHPFELPKVSKLTEEQIGWLREWSSVWDSVWDLVSASVRDLVWESVWASVGNSVRYSVGNSVRNSVRDSIGDSVRTSAWDLVWAYVSSFFNIQFGADFSSAVKLWESGLVPSFDGKVWRLHTGKDAHVVYELEVENG